MGRADHAVESRRAAGPIPYSTYPGGNPFPALNTGWATQPFPAFGVYVNAPMDINPTSLQQWNVSAQRQFGDWMLSTTYLGNKSTHLWRATELNPAVFAAGRDDRQHQPAPPADPAESRCRGSSTARSDTSTTPAAASITACCCRRSAA